MQSPGPGTQQAFNGGQLPTALRALSPEGWHMQVLRSKGLRKTEECGMQGAQGQDGPAWGPPSTPRRVAPTHRGTKESVFCKVVGSSSKREAMSLPWGTATKRYLIFSPAFRRPARP